jgi:two-component system response regulator AlgR
MKILIVDDEAPARERLRALLEELDLPCEVTAEASSGIEALACCQSRDIDLVLLDIRMPGMSGLEVAAELGNWDTPPAIIFTTAYNEYALDAFDQHAVDYLLKPIRRERLERALQRSSVLTRPQLSALEELSSPGEDFISANYRGGVQRIPLDDVIYFHADQKYVTVRYRDGELLLEESLKSLEERFASRVLRIHRNALVSKHRLTGLVKSPDGRAMASLRGADEQLEISRRHLSEVRRWLKQGD